MFVLPYFLVSLSEGCTDFSQRALKEVEIFQKHKGHAHFLLMHDHEVVRSKDGTEELLVLLDYYPVRHLSLLPEF